MNKEKFNRTRPKLNSDVDELQTHIKDLANKIYREFEIAVASLQRAGYVVLARSTPLSDNVPIQVIGYPKDEFDQLANDIGLDSAFKKAYDLLVPTTGYEPYFIYNRPLSEVSKMQKTYKPLGSIAPYIEKQPELTSESVLAANLLISADMAHLRATGISIGGKLWPYDMAVNNPSDELMMSFVELRRILGAINQRSNDGDLDFIAAKLEDKRLQTVLEACFKKLGYTLQEVPDRSPEPNAPVYFKISW